VRRSETKPNLGATVLVNISAPCRMAFLTGLLLLSSACARSGSTSASPAEPAATAATAEPAPSQPETAPPAFNASRAMEYVKEIVAFGPRPLGSEGHKKTENYILAHLKGDQVERDDFEITPAEGRFPVHNIIAKFAGTKDGIIVNGCRMLATRRTDGRSSGSAVGA